MSKTDEQILSESRDPELKSEIKTARRARLKLTPAEVAEALKADPLVAVMRAAQILDIPPPNFKRYKDQLTAVPIEGGSRDVYVYFRSEVEELGRTLAQQRAARNGSAH